MFSTCQALLICGRCLAAFKLHHEVTTFIQAPHWDTSHKGKKNHLRWSTQSISPIKDARLHLQQGSKTLSWASGSPLPSTCANPPAGPTASSRLGPTSALERPWAEPQPYMLLLNSPHAPSRDTNDLLGTSQIPHRGKFLCEQQENPKWMKAEREGNPSFRAQRLSSLMPASENNNPNVPNNHTSEPTASKRRFLSGLDTHVGLMGKYSSTDSPWRSSPGAHCACKSV